MGLFKKRKKKDEDIDGDETIEKESSKKVFKKSPLKDLNEDNKRKRREPKKPWGRSERLLIGGALIITAGVSGYLWLMSIGWKLPRFSKVNLEITSFFKEETIIIEKDESN